MPLAFMNVGEACQIRNVGGSAAVRRHLSDMGFVDGTEVTLVARTGCSVIVGIHGSRVALNGDLAQKIFV